MASIIAIDAAGRRIPKGSKVRPHRYVAKWRTPGGKSREQWFERKVDAENHLTTVESSKLSGGYVDRAAGEQTVGKFAKHWIATRRTKQGAPLAPRTKELYGQLLVTHIEPTLGSTKLRNLSPAVVRDWHSKLEGAVAPAKAYRLLKAMMSTAVDDELIARNPCRVDNGGVERPAERPIPTRDEVWALADAIDQRYRCVVLLAAFVGLRWSEITALRRSDIDLDERTISVCREARKTEAALRTVAFPPVLLPELRTHLDTYVGDNAEAHVFAGPKGAVPERSNFHSVWKKARDKVARPDAVVDRDESGYVARWRDVDGEMQERSFARKRDAVAHLAEAEHFRSPGSHVDELHLHDLRHYGATLAAQAGATTKELMARLGHASPAAALRYQHATAERDQALADRMNDMITAERSGEPSPTLRVVVGG